MIREDAVKVLAIIRTAYTNAYKDMTREDATGIINLWASQFNKVPVYLVVKAVENLVSTSKYPPAISEVWEQIRGFQKEAKNLLEQHNDCLKALENTDYMLNEGIPLEVVEQVKNDIRSRLLSAEEIRELHLIANIEGRENEELSLLSSLKK